MRSEMTDYELTGEVLANALEISKYVKHSIPHYKKKRKKLEKMWKKYEKGDMSKYIEANIYD